MYAKMTAMVVHLVGQELIASLNMDVKTMIELFCIVRALYLRLFTQYCSLGQTTITSMTIT